VPVRPTTTAQAPSTTGLIPPQQPPAAGNGRSHSQSGGS
jgi:hypothetical protein